MARNGNGMQKSLARMAAEDPELAAKVLVSALPAAAVSVRGRLDYRLVLDGLGEYHVAIDGGRADVTQESDNGGGGGIAAPNGRADFTLQTDPATFARLAAGASPLRLMLGGKLHVHGKRRRALKLRQMEGGLTMRDIVRAGVTPDPDLLYRALPYAIDPEWTRGHRFCMQYVVDGHGEWFIVVDDGAIETAASKPDCRPDAVARMSHDTWVALVGGDLIPNEAMRRGLVQVDGRMFPVTLMGRWIERAEGRDDAELEREVRQAAVQRRRATWGSATTDVGAGGQGDPAVDNSRRKGSQLMSYENLYALWERQNWKAHEIDFAVDKEQWLATPSISQLDTMWSFSSFYIGEERVAADLAPFVVAAPSGEIEIFLATQLVDEARHAAFFDRFMAEVMALDAEDIRGRLAAMEESMLPAWRTVFDDQLRGIAKQIQARPDDLDLFVEGIVTYHVVIEGVLAMTGQHQILKYLTDHEIFPGFCRGFSLVEQDEHRHIAFGVRFLAEVCEQEPRYRDLIERKIAELVPVAAHVFVPPGTEDPSDFVSFDYHSSEIYGFAYRALKRRMAVVGVDVPPPEELMPGPIDRIPAPA
jgi:ribonucleoside-diphosphate reductase beta chain